MVRGSWTRANPRKRTGKASKHLTPAQKSAAKTRARSAGRRYPNLVDSVRIAAKGERLLARYQRTKAQV